MSLPDSGNILLNFDDIERQVKTPKNNPNLDYFDDIDANEENLAQPINERLLTNESLIEEKQTPILIKEDHAGLNQPLLIEEEKEDLQESNTFIDNFDKEYLDVEVDPVEEGGEECESCYFQYLPEGFFSLSCGHKFCVNCTRNHLQYRIVNGKAMKIPCMTFKCKEHFKPHHIQKFCSKQVTQTYEGIAQDIKVSKNKNLKWCPQPGCGKVVRKPGCCANQA